jgi:hypothetical protein
VRWVFSKAVALAAVAGFISGSIIGGSEVFVLQNIFDGIEETGWRAQLPYWVAFFAFAGVVSAIEIAVLYWIGLRSIATLANVAQAELGDDGYAGLAARGLARAALEFPNPRVVVFGIDPYALVPGWKMVAWNIAYKMKVGVTSFLLRVFLRRVAARMAVRGLIPLFAGPLYAAWNAFITWRIMCEARIRIFGPFAIERLVRSLSHDTEPLSASAAGVMLQSVGEMVVRGRDAHPNVIYFMSRLMQELDVNEEKIRVNWQGKRARLRSLSPHEREAVLDVLTLAILLGSNIHGAQKAMLHEVFRHLGIEFREAELKRLRQDLKSGRVIGPKGLAAVRG